MKKLVSILVVLAMLMSMVPAVYAAEDNVIYSQEDLALTVTYNQYGEAIANSHEYTWTATADGTVTVNVTSVDPGVKFWFGDSLPNSTTKAASYDFAVTEGTEYLFKIIGFANWTECAATVSFNLAFATGEGDTVVESENYVISAQTLSLGENTVTLEANALNSLYEFAPAAAGVYEFTAAEGIQLGYWGTTNYPFDGTEAKSNTLTYTLTNENQSILVGVVNGDNTGDVTITVAKTADAGETVIEAVTYENKATLSQFTVPENAVLGDYVDVYGETHAAFLGEDGYYHLGNPEGDILLVDMNHIATLSDALKSERPVMYAYVTDAEGNQVKYDIGNAVLAYEAVCDENGYYPLTEDLKFFYEVYAAGAGIYQFYLGEGYNADCAWMFACRTMTLTEAEPAGTAVYLDPGESWPSDGAWYAAYYWNGASGANGWVALTDIDADGIYEGEIPADYDNVIFNRMNPASTALDWSNKWNQTVDLTVPTDGSNLFTIENPWNESYEWKATGSWSAMPTQDEEETLTGSGTETDPYIITSLPYDLSVTYADEGTAWDGVFYQYTAEQTGYIEVANLDDDFNTGTLVESESWTMLTDGQGLSVTEGDVILFYHWGTEAKTYDLTLQYGTVPEGGDTGDGGEGGEGGDEGGETVTPDSGEWSGTDVAVAADESIVITYTPDTNGVLTVAISCETGWQVVAGDGNDEESYWSEYSESPVSFNLTAGTTYTITIYPFDEADGWTTCDAVMTYELTWAAESKENAGGSGTDEDPYILTVNADNYATITGDGESCDVVWFTWTATGAGELLLTFDESDPQPYVTIYVNSATYAPFQSGAEQWTANVTLEEGDVIYITVETYNWDSADYTFYASFTSEGGNEGGEGGDTETSETLTDGDNSIELPAAADSVTYTYTATETGTLYVIATYLGWDSSASGEYEDDTAYMADDFAYYCVLYVNGMPLENAYYGPVDVVAGQTYTFEWVDENTWNPNQGWEATLNLSYSDELFPVMGTADMPVELSSYDCPTESIEIAAGSTAYYNLYSFGGMNFTVEGENAYVLVSSYDPMTYEQIWVRYDAVDGVVTVPISGMGWGATVVQIGNAGTEAAVFALNGYYPVGSPYNPDQISGEGTFTVELDENSQGYYFNWTAEEEGLLTVTVNGESWSYAVNNMTTYVYGDYHNSTDNPVVSSETVAAFAGYVYEIAVNTAYDEMTGTYPAGAVEVIISFEPCEVPEGSEYNPYDVYYFDCPVEITVPGGEEVYVKLSGFQNFEATTFTGDFGYVIYDGTKYEAVDGVVTIAVTDTPVTVILGNSGSEEVAYTVNYVAALGSEYNPEVIIENGEYTTSVFEEGTYGNYYYEYTAPANGTITFEILNDTDWYIYAYNETSGDYVQGFFKNAETNIFTMEVSAGDFVAIQVRPRTADYPNAASAVSFNFTFEELTAAPGTEENPYVIQFTDCYETPVETVEIAAGTAVYYALKGFYGNIAVVAGDDAYIIYNGVTYTAENGVIELVADDTTMLLQIGNSGEEAAVFTVAGEFPLGTGMNPEKIGEGQTVVEVEENDDHYYTSFTAECDGYVTVTISGSDWQYMIYNITSGQMFYDGAWTNMGQWTYCTSTEDVAEVTFDVMMGEEIQIVVNTVYVSDGWDDLYGSSAAGTIYIDLAVAYDHLDEDPEDGICDLCGAELTTILLGDVNGDGNINILDANLAASYYNEVIDLTEEQVAAADVNGDGIVNILDANLIAAYYNEVIDSFPAEEK